VGFAAWFGYDTYIVPMEEHLDFNFYGFKVVSGAAAWYGYLAWTEMKGHEESAWVRVGILGVLAAWLGAEALGLPGFDLPTSIEYPVLSRYGFFLCLGLIPIFFWRDWSRARRRAERRAAAED
jgi:hypothetical protein